MNRLFNTPAHKLIFWICFIPTITFIILYELLLTNFPSSSDTIYKIGIIASKISYSIVAASIFYFISQYLPIYLPKKRKKIKIIPFVHQQTLLIDYYINELKSNLNIQQDEFKNDIIFKDALNKINVDHPIDEFENWHQYLYHLKLELLDVIRSLYFHIDFLSAEYMHELILMDKQLMAPRIFASYKTIKCTNLSYTETILHELLVHNQHLQFLREIESKKYERELKAAGKAYRKTYYNDKK